MEEITKNDKLKIAVAINDELDLLEANLRVIEKDMQLCEDNDRLYDLICDKDLTEQNIYQYKEIIKKLGV